jgi:hypothetical protein
MAWAELNHTGVPTWAVLVSLGEIVKQLLDRIRIAQTSGSQTASMHHLGISSSVAAFCQGDQALSLTTHSIGLCARRLDALVLEQLLDQDAPQSSSVILATTKFVSSYSVSHDLITPILCRFRL